MSFRNVWDVPLKVRVLENGGPFQNGGLLAGVTGDDYMTLSDGCDSPGSINALAGSGTTIFALAPAPLPRGSLKWERQRSYPAAVPSVLRHTTQSAELS
jgi:hypothetical protein